MTMGRKLAKTCYEMYAQMETKLSPEIAYFNMMPGVKQDINVKVRTILYLGIGTETRYDTKYWYPMGQSIISNKFSIISYLVRFKMYI